MDNLSSLLNLALAVLVAIGLGMLLIFMFGVMVNRGMKRDREADAANSSKKPEK